MVQLAAWIFRDFVTDGVPSSGAHPPKKAEIREWGTYVEALYAAVQAGGGVVFQTKASMTLGYAANQIAWVVADATAANNGIYQKQGASGSGSWLKVAELPYSVIYAQNDNSGTANAVKATASVPVSTAAYSQLITVPFTVANTGAMTLSINNETPRPLVTNTGQAIAAGYMQPGMAAFVQIDGAGKYRLFSYGDASAIQAAAEAARTGAEAARDAAQAAVSSIVPNTFATRAAATAYSPVVAPDFLSIAGYTVSGDGGAALYKKVGSQPSHAGKFSITLQNATVVWYEIAEEVLRPEMFGAIGNDIADDTAKWQTAAQLAAGKRLEGYPGKTYNLTGTISLGDGTHLDLCGARLNFRISGSVRCLVSGSGCTIENGSIKNYGTAGLTPGDYQCPICIGTFSSNVAVKNVIVRNMWIDSDWGDGNGIGVFAASHNILIENITVPDPSPMFCPVLLHWGGTSAGTGHPHDVIIRNVVAGDISASGFLVSLASAYNVLIENVKGGRCFFGFHNYAGDFTNMYAPAAVKPLIGRNIIARNILATDVRNSGIWIDGQSFNPSLTTPPATPIALSCVVENSTFYGVGGIAQAPEPAAPYAARLANCSDVELRNNKFEWFENGIVPTGPTEQVRIIGNSIRSCKFNGIFISLTPSPPVNWLVQGNACAVNNRGGVTSDFGAAIYVGASENAKIIDNRIGLAVGEFSFFGVRVGTTAVKPVIRDNYVRSLAASGVAYSIGSATSYDINATGGNNRAAPGITMWGGTTLFQTDVTGRRVGVSVESGAPSAGTWMAGDRLYRMAPTSTIIGDICTAAGTPGTWRTFGA